MTQRNKQEPETFRDLLTSFDASIVEVADWCVVSKTYLYDLMSGERKRVGDEVIDRLAHGLDDHIHLCEVSRKVTPARVRKALGQTLQALALTGQA
jgi:hypothetical protein